MIRYALRCQNEHSFESWFQSADGFDRLLAADQVSCPECGETNVEKAVMAPRVGTGGKAPAPAQMLAKLKAHVEANSDYVGPDFASEARKIHAGDAPERSIYGEAKPEEAKKLVEDGIPALPLPFIPKRKTN